MHRSSKIYKDTANIVANPREVEANLLYQSASRLQAIQDHWEEKASELRDALLYNRRLWTIFLTSVTHAENPLPKEIRENVANLGVFVLRRTLSLQAEPRPDRLSILIGINRNLASGLLNSRISLRGQSVRDPRERHAMAPKRAFA